MLRTFSLTVALLALAGAAHADVDPEPPSGGRSLQALKGKWNSVQRISKEIPYAYSTATYEFDGAKVKYTLQAKKGNPLTKTMTAKIDPKRPGVLELKLDRTKTTSRYFFKIEKDKLYLTPDRSDDPNAKADFTGNDAPVVVYQMGK